MSGASGAEREERALDALIASGLRRCDTEDEVDPEQLPELSAEEKEALAALGPEFVSRLLKGRISRTRRRDEVPRSDDTLATVGGVGVGLNRAEEMKRLESAPRLGCGVIVEPRLGVRCVEVYPWQIGT